MKRVVRRDAPGAALLWVVLLGGFMSVLCLYFLTTGHEARLRADFDHAEVTADDLLASAKGEILAKLDEGFSVGAGEGSVAAMPGLLEVKRYDEPLNRGGETGEAAFENDAFFAKPFAAEYGGKPANPRWIPMFSWKDFAPRLKHLSVDGGAPAKENPDYNPYAAFNINTADNPWQPGTTWITGVPEASGATVRTSLAGQGKEIAPGSTSAERPIWVQWIPVLKDPSQPPSAKNPMIGRYAYWVDLENTKLRADLPLRSIRGEAAYGRLVGESGAVDGGRSPYDQDGHNSARGLLAKLEQVVPGKDIEGQPATRGGRPGPGLSALHARDAREAWLGPDAPASTTDLVDWAFFESPRRSRAEGMTAGKDLADQLANAGSRARPAHPWFSDLRAAVGNDAERVKLARQVGTALTFQGEEEQLDPLGRPRIDLQEFQKQATGNRGTTVSLAAITGSELWSRLGDGAYQRAYQPGAKAKSFFDSLAPFAPSGQSAALQMLVNVAEAAQPDSVPPLIDTAAGIVGARSMPYVAEVSTRARSAYWLLPKEDREDRTKLLQTTGTGSYGYTYKQKRLHHYATHAVVDLCIGLVNPDPFETEPFTGEIEFDITWGTLPAGATVEKTFKAPLHGHFTANSLPGKDAKELQPLGHTVNIRLGVFPVAALNDDKFASCLRIRGWKIRRGGQVWHQVPVKHPGAAGSIDWWRMSQAGTNAGSADDDSSLAAYRDGGGRSVGWFCMKTLDALIPESLGVSGWTDANATDTAMKSRVATWLDLTPKTSVMERVVCLDPTLGHRTGNPMLPGLFGRGHFYGAQGHFWRRQPVIKPQPVVYVGQTLPKIDHLADTRWEVSAMAGGSASVTVQRESGGRLSAANASWPVADSTATRLADYSGECLTHELIVPGTEGEPGGGKRADSLTAIYRIPSVEGEAAPGRLGLPALPTTVKIDAATAVKNTDLEVAASPVDEDKFTKLPDGKKGARGFHCSAPAKRYFTSPGEIGFCHSGFPLTPIQIGPDEGRTPNQLNSPLNGPPMRMLLDLLRMPSSGPAWNVNTSVAHDEYLALREGGETTQELKDSSDVGKDPLHAVWLPAAQGFLPRETGSESYRGKEAKNLAEKSPGSLLDRNLSPFPQLRRPWDMWLGVVGGDFSRSGESLRWGVGNAAFDFFGPGFFTWRPGDGAGGDPWIDFGSDLPGQGRLLAYGVDGRKDDKNDGKGTLKGRHAADQNLDLINGGAGFHMPAHFATRFSLLPVRHFRSDLAIDYHQESHESGWLRFKTALNPGLGAASSAGDMAGDKELGESMDGASFPGGHHSSGIFYQAPMALLVNQAGVSANAFSAYVVVESVRDRGKKREGVANSGRGHCDPDDEVVARRWARILILKERDASGAARFRTVLTDTAGH
ncbi:hypothetical protein OKA04_15020 [Luteolibacter flavescens]|uniref:Uncharacterized protein n=1 Tax=Luteolibacter flavescens TaxID=1859460 RepID=A0ABT3FR44_9BACT|nr:hypothetical protein [Luteolibacter flavescens]MCW1886048.1 hypothetical protein [Luteolibacter flavescens]